MCGQDNELLHMPNKTLKAILIDDEEDALEGLKALLHNFIDTPVHVIATAQDLDKGIMLIRNHAPDVVFLDIDMPGKNGLALYETFSKPRFNVIFTTAYQEYAIDALRNKAVDYLLKPVDFIELKEAIQKIVKNKRAEQRLLALEDQMLQTIPPHMKGKNIMFPVQGGFEIYNTQHIEFVEAEQMYARLTLFSGRSVILSKPLKEIEELLPKDTFLRTHKSFLVNVFYIRKYRKSQKHLVILRSGAEIPVAVRNVSAFLDELHKRLED